MILDGNPTGWTVSNADSSQTIVHSVALKNNHQCNLNWLVANSDEWLAHFNGQKLSHAKLRPTLRVWTLFPTLIMNGFKAMLGRLPIELHLPHTELSLSCLHYTREAPDSSFDLKRSLLVLILHSTQGLNPGFLSARRLCCHCAVSSYAD